MGAISNTISAKEREHLFSMLHRFLVWVGEPLPDIVEVNGERIEVHKLIWDCIQNSLSDQEKEKLTGLIHFLEEKEVHDENDLKNANITLEDAQRLYHDAASLIRAISDLRTCEAGELKPNPPRGETEYKTEDIKRWLSFLKNVGRKGTS